MYITKQSSAERRRRKKGKCMDLKTQKRILEAIVAERPNTEGLTTEIRMHDAADMASGIADKDTETLILNSKSMRKVKARVALSKIADGSYGTCVECDGKISPKRLEAVPEAILCIRCQERTEQGMPAANGLVKDDHLALLEQ